MLRRAEHDGPGGDARLSAPAPGRAVTRARTGWLNELPSSVRKSCVTPALWALRADVPPYLRGSVRPWLRSGVAPDEPPRRPLARLARRLRPAAVPGGAGSRGRAGRRRTARRRPGRLPRAPLRSP